jgi:hypothetical protein
MKKKYKLFAVASILCLCFISTLFLPSVNAATVVIDSSTSTSDSYTQLWYVFPSPTDSGALGQTWTGLANYNVTSASFFLRKVGSPVGNLIVEIYATTGTFGSTSKPTGSALASSELVSMAGLTTSFAWVNFTFAIPFAMNAQKYAIAVEAHDATTLNTSNYPAANQYDSNVHAGNFFAYSDSWWSSSGQDVPFIVYGVSTSSGTVASWNYSFDGSTTGSIDGVPRDLIKSVDGVA